MKSLSWQASSERVSLGSRKKERVFLFVCVLHGIHESSKKKKKEKKENKKIKKRE